MSLIVTNEQIQELYNLTSYSGARVKMRAILDCVGKEHKKPKDITILDIADYEKTSKEEVISFMAK